MKKILNEGIRFSVFSLKGQKSNKEGNKNKIASNTDIVLYFHFFVVLILVVPFCRHHHASFAHEQRHKDGCLSAPPKVWRSGWRTWRWRKKAPEYFRFHVYQTVTYDNMHRGGVLRDGQNMTGPFRVLWGKKRRELQPEMASKGVQILH